MLAIVQSIGFGDVKWVAHPEVWMLLAGIVAIGWFASRVLEPKAVLAGYEPISRSQRRWFALGFVGIWLASDWPVHDVAENYLYSVHMVQHLLLSMLIPAAFVLATPRWLLELVISPDSRTWRWFRKASSPLFAGLVFNALTMWLHWSRVVQLSADSGPVHFGFHLMIFTSGLLMWMPVIGPITEWRLEPLGQCIYLFCMSIVPTVPGGWLVFADGVVYRNYDVPQRLWGIDVLADQQAAGAIMKLFGGFVLWVIILIIFSKWARSEMRADEEAREQRVRDARAETLTFEHVSKAFATTPAPIDPRDGTQPAE
jgi:putative membrane protein